MNGVRGHWEEGLGGKGGDCDWDVQNNNQLKKIGGK